jgi:GWxTD domain-containing protein
MKRILILLLGMITFQGHAALNAYFSYATFDRPSSSPYIETYVHVSGQSVTLAENTFGKFQGKIEIQWVYKRSDSIIHYDKYNLLSPESETNSLKGKDFIDQQRVSLENGEYEIELRIKDLNSAEDAFTLRQKIKIDFPEDKISISEIQLIESYQSSDRNGTFDKNGYELIPYVNSYFPKEIKTLKFYAEIYRTLSLYGEDHVLRYSISNSGNNRILNEFASIRKQEPREVNVLLAEIPIEKLYSGNYNLTIEVFDKSNRLLAARQLFFQRSNLSEPGMLVEDYTNAEIMNTFVSEMNDPAILADHVSSLYPVSSRTEARTAENLIAMNDVEKMKKYLYAFWQRKNPENPELAWLNYKAEVEKVQQSFGTRNKKGYETDRGRVYLQYGPPNSITGDDMDPTARPYSIWHYYQLGHQTNRKFVFYSLGNSSNDYQLLHSDAQGELQDPAWELKLHSRTQQFGVDMDAENSFDTYGSKTKENFSNPK